MYRQDYKGIIAICDDEKNVVEELKRMIDSSLKTCGEKYQIWSFTSGIELVKCIEKIDLVFLDIDMPEEDGFSIGNKIRKMNPDCKIIMATGCESCYKEAFKIQALRYVTKPFAIKEVIEGIQAFFNTRRGETSIEAFYNRNIYKVKQKEILYIHAMDSYSEIIIQNRTLRTEKSMSKLEEELDKCLFFRIHKQFIVNMSAIEKYKKNSVVIQGKEFSVSRRKKTEFEMRYLEYDLKYR